MSNSPHLRGIVIAGVLAAVALGLGFVTLAMNQTASKAAPPQTILPLKDRVHGAAHTTLSTAGKSKVPVKTTPKVVPKAPLPTAKPKPKPKPKPVNANVAAALQAGLPAPVAQALGTHTVAVVELTTHEDPVAELSAGEAQSGAALANAAYVPVDVDHDGKTVSTLTRLLGKLPMIPAALVYARPSTLVVTLPGFNDRTAIQQAAMTASQQAVSAATVQPAAAKVVAPPLTWAQQADALCQATDKQLASLGGTSNAQHLADNQVRFDAVSTRFIGGMKGLKAATGKTAAVAQLNGLLNQYFSALDEMIAAQIRHDVPGVAAARARAGVLGPQVTKLEQRLGATGCAEQAT